MKRKTKVLIMVILAAAFLLSTGAVMASAQTNTDRTVSTARLFVDGREVATSHGANDSFIINGTTFLPLSAMRSALGADIVWQYETSVVYINSIPQTQDFTDVHGNVVEPFMVGDVAYLPLRAVAEALGMAVGWNGAQNMIIVGNANEFTVTAGDQTYTVTMSELSELGLVEFYAIDRRGGGEVRVDFTGVPIAAIFDSLNIDLSAIENLTFTAANGNTGVIPADDALNPEYGFLAVTEDGVPLGSWADGGGGPFRLVLSQDSFPQRWLRNVVGITLEFNDAQAADEILITGTGGVTRTVTVDDILGLEPQAVSATIRGDVRNFTGVPLAQIFRLAGVQYSGGDAVILRAPDGFSTVLAIDEALDEANVFVTWLEDGEPVTTDENRPFMLVVAQDTVPVRMIRNISEITILAQAGDAGNTVADDLGDYEFMIVAGDQTHIVTMEDIIALEPFTFYADGVGGVRTQFTGVPLVTLLQHLDIDYSGFTNVIFSSDISMEWTSEEAFDSERGFVVIEQDGEPLDEFKDLDAGSFMTVLVGAGPNRWLRQLQVITLR